MIIEREQLYTVVYADQGKMFIDGENNFSKQIYVPKTLSDDDIKNMFTQIDENDFQINVPFNTYTKLQIRRTCRELGLQQKLNTLININERIHNDWSDAQEINLNDEIFNQAINIGVFTQEQIDLIKSKLK